MKYNFPNAIGAIDCTHVLILKPTTHGDEYINRKGLASFNVQVTCDANELITSMDCRWAGSVHDSRIWRNSGVCEIMTENQMGALLLGDEGYGLTPWLMTPYRNTEARFQARYNKLHSKERVVVERVFGQAKKRFPILQSKIRVKTQKIPSLIGSCFILHNVSKHLNEPDHDDVEYILDREENEPIYNDNRDLILRRRGELRRNAIANHLFGTN